MNNQYLIMVTNVQLNNTLDHIGDLKYPFLSYLLLLKKKGRACQVWQPLSQWLNGNMTYLMTYGLKHIFRVLFASGVRPLISNELNGVNINSLT